MLFFLGLICFEFATGKDTKLCCISMEMEVYFRMQCSTLHSLQYIRKNLAAEVSLTQSTFSDSFLTPFSIILQPRFQRTAVRWPFQSFFHSSAFKDTPSRMLGKAATSALLCKYKIFLSISQNKVLSSGYRSWFSLFSAIY